MVIPVLVAALAALVALWLYLDRRQAAARAAGSRPPDALTTPAASATPPSQRPPSHYAIALSPIVFGPPAPAFESAGTWLSSRGNCRNTAWTPALGPRTPRLAWRWAAPSPYAGSFDSIVGAAVVNRDGIVFVATSGGLTAISPDGKELWSLGDSAAAAPAIDLDGNAVTAFAGELLVAAPSGASTWYDCELPSPRAVTVADDGTIFVTSESVTIDGGRVTAIGADGTDRWTVSCLRSIDFAPAIALSGVVHVSSDDTKVRNSEDASAGYDRLQTLSSNGAEMSRVDVNDEGDTSVWGGTAAMCLEDGTPIVGIGEGVRVGANVLACKGRGVPALSPDGTLYVSSGGLVAIDLTTGKEKWKSESGTELPVIDGEGTIFAADGGTIFAVSPSGVTLWSWTVPLPASGSAGALQGLSIGPNRTLYVAMRAELFALRDS